MKPGKLAAMVGHCCEAYWTNLIKKDPPLAPAFTENGGNAPYYRMVLTIPRDVLDEYVFGIFTKTICEAKNLNDLKKVENVIKDINEHSFVQRMSDDKTLILGDKVLLQEGRDYGYINDKCLTDLTPENPDGTCTVGIWFRPLPDDIAHKLSKKYKLYGAFDK